jgi:hypothetical protein
LEENKRTPSHIEAQEGKKIQLNYPEFWASMDPPPRPIRKLISDDAPVKPG